MANASVDIFLRDIAIMAKTMVIRSDIVAAQVNSELRFYYPFIVIDPDQPSTWKYYQNIAGEYHFTDLERIAEINGDGNPYMTIQVAGDTGPVVINFTKETISGATSDAALAVEYSYGSNFYNELVARYPDFEQLILGILNPIDYEISTRSYNGDILYAGGWYRTFVDNDPKNYHFVSQVKAGISNKLMVESNEYTLLYRLQHWIKAMLEQWVVNDYTRDNDLYSTSIWITLMSKLPTQIFNLRLDQIKSNTGETHSFHYTEYLNSHGDLGKHIPYLTLDQAMFLYKNMGWLENNIGKQEVFDVLVDNLLTPAGVPIAAYILKHDLSTLESDTTVDPYMERKYLNFRSIGAGSDARSIEEIVIKSVNLARDNGLFIEDQIRQITNMSRNSRYNSVPTKVLESDMMDDRDGIQYPKAAFLMNMWLYSIKYGTYRGSIFVTHPITGQRMQFTPLNAFILMYYTWCRGYCNVELEYFPRLGARIIPKNEQPPYTEFRDPYPGLKPFPTIKELKWCYSSKKITDLDLYRLQYGVKPTFRYNSTLAFNVDAAHHHKRLMDRWGQAMQFEDLEACGQFEWLVNKHYWFDVDIGQLTELPMAEWLKNFGIDFDDMSDVDYRILCNDLIKGGTGTTEQDGDWLAEMQSAVLDILMHFSSYTIQVIKTFRNGSATPAGFKSLRLGNEVWTAKVSENIPVAISQMAGLSEFGKTSDATVSTRRNTTWEDEHGYEIATLGLSTRRYEGGFLHMQRDLDVTNRMQVIWEGQLESNREEEYSQSESLALDIMFTKPVGILTDSISFKLGK